MLWSFIWGLLFFVGGWVASLFFAYMLLLALCNLTTKLSKK